MMQFLSNYFGDNVVIAVYIDNEGNVKQESVSSSHVNYEPIRKAVVNKDVEGFVALLSPKSKVETFVQNGVRVNTGIKISDEGDVTYNDKPLNHVLVEVIKKALYSNLPVNPLKAFLVNLFDNPSSRAVNELWRFIEAAGLTLTEDGCFLAYKTVLSDYYSKTAGNLVLIQGKVREDGRIYNGVGETIKCNRRDVDDEKDRTCSHGLHAGALAYAGPGGYFNSSNDKVVIVKINPADVVSVPSDYSGQKLRVCKYVVVAEYQGKLAHNEVYSGEVDYDNDDYGDDDYYDDYYDDEDEYEEDDFDASEMLEGMLYSFDYDKNGEVSRRYLLVENNNKDYDYVYGTLIHPAKNAGEVRQFKYSNISNIEEVDL